jgi:hypothetical protein
MTALRLRDGSSALMLFREIIAVLRIIRENLNALWGKLQSFWLLNHVVYVVVTMLLSNYVIVKSQKRNVRIFNSNNQMNNFPVYYPDFYLQLNKFRAFSRPSSGA